MALNINPRLSARLVVEGVLSNLAFQRDRLPLAWNKMHPILERCDSEPVRDLARLYSPGMLRGKQKPVVDLFDALFLRRGETEVQALQVLADELEGFASIMGLKFFFDCWKELVDSRWSIFQGAMYHSPRIADLKTSEAVPLRDVLDEKIEGEGLSKIGIEVLPEMKPAMVAPLIQYARARIGKNTKIAVLSPERGQTDLTLVSLLHFYPLLEVARWDSLARGLRPVTVFGLTPDLYELKSLQSEGAWCVIDASGGIVNDNIWDGLVKYLKPVLQFRIGRSNELHDYPWVARVQDLGLDPGLEPGPRIGIKREPASEYPAESPAEYPDDPEPKPKRVRKRKPRTKAKPKPVPEAKPEPEAKPKPEPKPEPEPQPETKLKAEPVAKPSPAPVPPPATLPAAVPPSPPQTQVIRTLPQASIDVRTLDTNHARRAFQMAAAAMEGAIKVELSESRDLEYTQAALKQRLEFEARQYYNLNRPRGVRAVRFLWDRMLDKTGDPAVLDLLRRLGLK